MKGHPDFWPFDRFWSEVERLIRKSRVSGGGEGSMIDTRMKETDREVIAVVEIPGLYERHDLDIRVLENRLMVRGGTGFEKKKGAGENPAWIQQSEMFFFVALPLPAPVKEDGMQTELKGNTLIVRLPKRTKDE